MILLLPAFPSPLVYILKKSTRVSCSSTDSSGNSRHKNLRAIGGKSEFLERYCVPCCHAQRLVVSLSPVTTMFIRSDDTALSLSEDGLEKNSHPVSSLSDESVEADSVNQEGSMISDQDTHLHNFCKCLSTDAPWPCVLHACFASS